VSVNQFTLTTRAWRQKECSKLLPEASMNNPPQPQPTQPADPDMTLLFLGSWFATLHDAPKRNHAKLNALAWHILGERPKTLLGLAIKACAEKWLRRRLWMVDFAHPNSALALSSKLRRASAMAKRRKRRTVPLQFTSHPHRVGTARIVRFFPITQAATVLGTPEPKRPPPRQRERKAIVFGPWSAPWVLAAVFLFLLPHRLAGRVLALEPIG
jgi:hypothetical protein